MDSLVLTLAIRCLPASDAFTASCVCRQWRAALAAGRDGGSLWKQICQNTNPAVTKSATQLDETLDFRKFALGLIRTGDATVAQLPPPSFVPTLRPEDVFATVELYRVLEEDGKRRRVTLASWVRPLSYPKIHLVDEDNDVVLNVPNPYSRSSAIASEASLQPPRGLDIVSLKKLLLTDRRSTSRARVQVTLFRRDNMKSVRVVDHTGYRYPYGTHGGNGYIFRFNDSWRSPSLPLANSAAGRKAQLLMRDKNYRKVMVCGSLVVESMLPPRGSDDEPSWLASNRQGEQLSESDIEALAGIEEFFEFKVKSFSFMVATKGVQPSVPFNCEDHMMVLVEGLCWE